MSPQDTTSNYASDETRSGPKLSEDLPGGEVKDPTNTKEVERLEILEGLADRVMDLFKQRVKDRQPKELEWVQCRRLYNAPMSAAPNESETPFQDDKATAKRRPIPNIVRSKCDTAIANSVSMQFSGGEKNWDLFPAPNERDEVNLEKARLMEREIETQLSQSKYGFNCRQAISERVIEGSGVLKGPVNTGKMQVTYEQIDQDTWVPRVSDRKSPSITYVPIWRFYPDMSVTNFDECGDAIEVHTKTKLELSQLIKHTGFDGDQIRRILRGDEDCDPISPGEYNETLTYLSAEAWARNPYLQKDRYLVLEYHGPVTYDELCKLGVEPTYESPTLEYYGEVWVCCGKVIRMELENIEAAYETPYSLSTWKDDPSSVFGYGHPLLLQDPQRVVTQSYWMMLDNAAITSGPQVAMYRKYIQPIDGNWSLEPNKFWWLTDSSVSVDNAIKFFYPPNVIGNIMPVFQLAKQFADEESSTPAIAAGLPSPDTQDTATGNLIMRQASTTILDFLAEEWDDQVTEKVIRRMYAWNMQYSDKSDIKGNYIIDVKSSSEYKNKQMYIRDLERLQLEATQNPATARVLNMDELTKARLALMHLPDIRIMKTPEQIQQYDQQQAQQPNPAMLKLQIEQQQVQIDQQRLQLQAQQQQFENTLNQQRAQWEYEEKQGANQARLVEAQASVIKARSEAQAEMLKLAQRDQHFAAKIQNDKELALLGQQSEVFLESMKGAREQQKNVMTQEELNLKRETGSGI